MTLPEILAPAGDMTGLQAALDAGADAVYLGMKSLNMRQMATRNFDDAMLADAAARCRAYGAKLYLTLNSIIYEHELPEMRAQLEFAKPHIDAVILADWAVAESCKELGIPFHISTQMSCSNAAAARFMKAQGASRIVLARECTLDEVAVIARTADIEIETFVHGAICVAQSGRCLLSHHAYGKSASRGECFQPCRRRFHIREVIEDERCTAEFEVTPHAVLSARDLCSLPFVDRLMAAGVSAFKIEGRARNPEYVATVVRAYKAAVAAVSENRFTKELVDALVAACATVYHREFGVGLYHGRPGDDQFTGEITDNLATKKKKYAGIVQNYFKQAGIAQVLIHDAEISVSDAISIHGPSTGVLDLCVDAMRRDDEVVTRAERGTWVTLRTPAHVRTGDKVFLVCDADPRT